MKKLISFFLVTILIGTLVIGCTTSSPAPPPSPKATTTPTATAAPSTTTPATPAPSAETWNLRFAFEDSPDAFISVGGHLPFAKAFEQATNGRVKVTPYPAGTLIASKDAYTGCISGLADISSMVTSLAPGQFPMTEMVLLPFMGFTSGESASSILWDLYEKFPAIQAEYKQVKVLCLNTTSPYWLLTKKQVKTLDDLKGMKIRILGSLGLMVEKLGAVPMSVGMPGVYQNLQKGVMDGIALPWEAYGSFRLFETAKYGVMNLSMCVIPFAKIMNLNVWNSFPPDIQKQIMSISGKSRGMTYAREGFDKVELSSRQKAKDAGYELIETSLTPEELARWKAQGGKPVHDAVISQLESKGLPAQQVFNEMSRLIKEYK